MTAEKLLHWYIRDLNKLKEEITLYKDDRDVWIISAAIGNSAGNLALHITGNLKHFIGAQLGNTGYVRQRDREFSERNVPKAELLKGVEEALAEVRATLQRLSDEDLQKDFPIPFLEKTRPVIEILFILYGHLNYHLGQVNYHRRLLAQ